jgi:phosphocarrier protein
MHARPAGRFVTLATEFSCEISVGKDDEWVNGGSVLSILSLAAAKGTVLQIRAVGDECSRAVAELGALIESDEDFQA